MKQKLKIHYNIRSTVKTPVTYWYPKLYRGTITPRASPQQFTPEASQETSPKSFPE
jgi:hypothetical protein